MGTIGDFPVRPSPINNITIIYGGMENDWSADIESVLENVRINCILLAKQHKKQYFRLKGILMYFRLPVIIMSGINSIVSVGTQPYLEQQTISISTCFLALVCSIIGSIELYLGIQKGMENEYIAQQSFYLLSVDIFKTLSLSKEHRPIPAKEYLDKQYGEYCKLIENSHLLIKRLEDKLSPLPEHLAAIMNNSPSELELGFPLDRNNSDL